MSEQDAETKENPGPEGEGTPEEKEVDHLSDLSELEKIKLELQKEKDKATKELDLPIGSPMCKAFGSWQ